MTAGPSCWASVPKTWKRWPNRSTTRLKVRVLVVEPLGAQNLLTVKIGANTVKVSTHPSFEVAPNQDVWLRFPADKIRWIDRDSGRVLYPGVV